MGLIKWMLIIALTTIIINYGLHITIINKTEDIAKNAKEYVEHYCTTIQEPLPQNLQELDISNISITIQAPTT